MKDKRKDQIEREEAEKRARTPLRDGGAPKDKDAKTSKSAGKGLRSTPDEDTGPKGAGRLG